MGRPPILELRPEGLYCAAGGFYVDPWRPVDRAVVTHGHADHARWGCRRYLASPASEPILRARLGEGIDLEPLPFGEVRDLGGVRLSLHPAGHIRGSAQVRLEVQGEVWVFTGDYKTEPDPTTEPWEPVRCHTLITETTFGLPIYRWRPQAEVFAEVDAWWRANRAAGRASLLMAYALGKAQRLLAGVDPSIGPIVVHGAVGAMNDAYRASGIELPATNRAGDLGDEERSGALVVAPPSVQGTPWLRRFGEASTAFASGWMAVRGARRRRAVDRGFVLSDHVDWPSLLAAVAATGAQRVLTTHGYADAAARYFREQGLEADPLVTDFRGESVDAEDAPVAASAPELDPEADSGPG